MQIEVSVPAFRIDIPDEALNALGWQSLMDNHVNEMVDLYFGCHRPVVTVCEPQDRSVPPLANGDCVEVVGPSRCGRKGKIAALDSATGIADIDWDDGTESREDIGRFKRQG